MLRGRSSPSFSIDTRGRSRLLRRVRIARIFTEWATPGPPVLIAPVSEPGGGPTRAGRRKAQPAPSLEPTSVTKDRLKAGPAARPATDGGAAVDPGAPRRQFVLP